jgi:hypothetical protein
MQIEYEKKRKKFTKSFKPTANAIPCIEEVLGRGRIATEASQPTGKCRALLMQFANPASIAERRETSGNVQ